MKTKRTKYKNLRVTPEQYDKIQKLINVYKVNLCAELRAFIDQLYDRITGKTELK